MLVLCSRGSCSYRGSYKNEIRPNSILPLRVTACDNKRDHQIHPETQFHLWGRGDSFKYVSCDVLPFAADVGSKMFFPCTPLACVTQHCPHHLPHAVTTTCNGVWEVMWTGGVGCNGQEHYAVFTQEHCVGTGAGHTHNNIHDHIASLNDR